MLQKMRGTNQKGFTLIELMIVIAIIGILSAIAIPNFLSYRQKGKDSAAKSEASNFYVSVMAEYADAGISSTWTPDTPPTGFGKNPKINYTNSIVIDGNGTTASTMTFTHADGGQAYTLDASTGKVTP